MSVFDEGFNDPTQAPSLDQVLAQVQPPAPAPVLPAPAFAPPVSQTPIQRLLQAGSLIAAAIGGPHSGLGALPLGIMRGQQYAQQEADRQAQFQAQQQARVESQKLAQQRIDEQRQAVRGRALQSIAQTVPSFDNADEYNRFIENAGNTLLLNGYNTLGPNQLRQAYPFVAPTAEKKAKKVLDAWFKNPANAEALKKDPTLAQRAVVQFDANGDGVPENIPLTKLGEIAGSPFAMGPNGAPVSLGPDLTGDKFHVALNNEVAKFRATNRRDPNPQEMDALITEAGKVGKDPELADLQKESIQSRIALQNLQKGMLPTPEDAASIADDIISHRIAPSQAITIAQSRGGAGFKMQIERAVKKQDPTFNWQEGEATYQLAKSPTFQQTVRYMDYVGSSVDNVITAAQKLNNGNVRSINALINAGKNQVNDVNLATFRTARLEVADAIAKILQGGGSGSGTSDAKLRQAESILQESDSPAVIAATMAQIKDLIGKRRSALTKGTYLEQAQPEPAPVDPAASARQKLLNR